MKDADTNEFGNTFWNQDQPIWHLSTCGEILGVNPYLEKIFDSLGQDWRGTYLKKWLSQVSLESCSDWQARATPENPYPPDCKASLVLDGWITKIFHWHFFPLSSGGHSKEWWCWGRYLGEVVNAQIAEPNPSGLLTKILAQTVDGMITIDTHGIVLSFNRAAERLFGYQASEVLGNNVSMLMPSPDREKHDDYIEAYLTTKNAKILGKGREVKGLRKDGKTFPLHLTTSKPFPLGEDLGFLGIVRDLSQTKSIENQLRRAQKMESIGTLAGGIAHDFNNILGGISGYIELMLEDSNPGSALEEDLLEMKKACQRGRDLVLQILTFSRRDRAELEPMRLQPIIKESVKLLRATLPATIKLKEHIDPSCLPIVGDVTQIHQVLMNLGTNAYHAMREGGGALTVSLKPVILDDQFLGLSPNLPFGAYNLLQVSDTGCGISSEHIQRIFDPFFTTKAVGDGTGMGLAVVHGILQTHHGDITVISEVDKGSTFSLFFPIHADHAVSENATAEKEASVAGKEHLVVIDDDVMLLKVVSRILRRAGFRVSAFENGVAAINAILDPKESVDLLITDQTMPEITGTEVAKRILDRKPNFPIILTTGYSESITREKALESGFTELLMKPVGKNELLTSIQKIFSQA